MKISVCWLARENGVPIPKGYRYSYAEAVKAVNVYYPLPINYIVRYWRRCYWTFLAFFYRMGIIDVAVNEEFRWADFYRIKTH